VLAEPGRNRTTEQYDRPPQKRRHCRWPTQSLRAVSALGNGASAEEVRNYLGQEWVLLAVRPNHLGRTLHRHRVAGRLEQRDSRWWTPDRPLLHRRLRRHHNRVLAELLDSPTASSVTGSVGNSERKFHSRPHGIDTDDLICVY
jgi:hypothetical protein